MAKEYIDERLARRAAVLFVQLVVLYIVAVLSLSGGIVGLPVTLAAIFLAVYVSLRQVEGVVGDALDGQHD
ncbi:hypothetical protein [Halosimplex amylolyticum]|uniref:hypothetical protein n=1 Tax=Halosimplex amylolyticum TaxID=3396616 RepID=UPI003F54851B